MIYDRLLYLYFFVVDGVSRTVFDGSVVCFEICVLEDSILLCHVLKQISPCCFVFVFYNFSECTNFYI